MSLNFQVQQSKQIARLLKKLEDVTRRVSQLEDIRHSGKSPSIQGLPPSSVRKSKNADKPRTNTG